MNKKIILPLAIMGVAALSSCDFFDQLFTAVEGDIGRDAALSFVTQHYNTLTTNKTYSKMTVSWSFEVEGEDDISAFLSKCFDKMSLGLQSNELTYSHVFEETGGYRTVYLTAANFETNCPVSPYYDANGSVYSGEINSENEENYSQEYGDYYTLNEDETELTYWQYIGIGSLAYCKVSDTFDADGSLYSSSIEVKGYGDETTGESYLTGRIDRVFSN